MIAPSPASNDLVEHISAQIGRERVTTRGYGSGAWGWKIAYQEGIAV